MNLGFFEPVKTLVYTLIDGGHDPVRTWLIIAVGLLGSAGVLSWVASTMKGNTVPFVAALPVMIVDVLLVLVIMVLVRKYLCPRFNWPAESWGVPVVTALLGFVIILPLTARLLSINYLVTLAAAVCAGVALVLLVYLTALGYDTLRRGAGDMRNRRSMKQAEDRALSL